MEHPNVKVYREMLAAFEARDADAIAAHLAPDVRWHEAGSPTVLEGRDRVMAEFAHMQSVDSDVDVHDLLANDDHVLVLLNVRVTSPTGESVRYPVVEIHHVDDGLITERWAFMDACPGDVTEFFARLTG